MKFWKVLTLLLVGLVAAIAFSQIDSAFSSKLSTPRHSEPKPTEVRQTERASAGDRSRQQSAAAMASSYSEACLSPEQANRPAWECYEISVDEPTHKAITIQHESGQQYQVLTFQKNAQTTFRFTPTQKGIWRFSTGGEIAINADRSAYAKGFVMAKGSKWARSATGKAFVPQFVMYNQPDLDNGLDEFVDGHGFSGFHIKNLRDFLDNPEYFEAVVLKTYRRGGVTHFWIWGDKYRKTTPSTYGVDVDLLYTEIAARLAPIPGWTLGYGFDLFEWTTPKELDDLRARLRADCSYHHLIGGRGYKNQYKEISSNLDYASWEWHHPSYEDYREHLAQANHQRPVFSEDRFRIQRPDAAKNYDAEDTYKGLWHSAIAGGVANIWGHQPEGQEFSAPYPNKVALHTYSQFIGDYFTVDMEPDNALISDGYCLRDTHKAAICYSEQPNTVRFNLEEISNPRPVITVIDTRAAYQEIEVPLSETNSESTTFEWQPPYPSDWAFQIMSQTVSDRT